MSAREFPARTRLRELLLEIARTDFNSEILAQLCRDVHPDWLMTAVVHQNVVSLAHERLRSADGVPAATIEELGRRRIAAQLHRFRLEIAQTTVSAALGGVPWLTVKGRSLAQWYPDPSLREFNDLDVLVHPRDLEIALDLLNSAGVLPAGGNWHGFRKYEVAEIPLVVDGCSIDLHWNLVGMGEPRRQIRLLNEVLFERAVSRMSDGTEFLTLGPVDTLLHLCVNCGLDGGRRLRGLVDIDVVIRTGFVDLDDFVRRARQAGAGSLASAVLQRTRQLLHTPIPEHLVDDLSGKRFWLWLNRGVDRRSARRWKPTRGIASGVMLASSRDSSAAAVAALGRSLSRSVSQAVGRPGLTQPGGGLDWQRQPADGMINVHRRAYIDWVAASDNLATRAH